MELYRLGKASMADYLDELLGRGFQVIAPKMVDGSLAYGYLERGSEFVDGVPAFFGKPFMGRENILELSMGEPKPTVYFTRSCEVAAVGMLDDVRLRGPFADQIYLKKRMAIKLVNLACAKSCSPKAFCASLQGPRLESGFSMQLTDMGDHYLVELADDSLLSKLMAPADPGEAARARELVKVVGEEQGRVPTNPSLRWDDEIWAKLADKCIECGACTLACPTCFCYAVDHRDWSRQEDSCLWAGFTRMAGGNPRQALDARLRQRFYHKLEYHRDRYGYLLCTGCGRCTLACPVDIDIRDVMKHFAGDGHA